MSIPEVIQPLLDNYVELIGQRLPDLMAAVYLHGSIALDAFEPQHSDIDFITVINRRCTVHDTNSLADIHDHLAQTYPQWTMDGSYLQWSDLGKSSDAIEPYPYVNEEFQAQSKAGCEWVTWYLLKQRGVAVIGIDPKTLDIKLDWDDFLVAMHKNLNTYWVQFVCNLNRIAWLHSDGGIQWAVLGVLRQYYTFREYDITSKIGAGAYGLQSMPSRWKCIIQEALNIRQGKPASQYRLRVQRMIEARQFLQYVIDTCNQHFHPK